MVVRIARWAVPNSLSSAIEEKLFRPYWIAWDKMDLSDPDHPRATISKEELEKTR